MKKLFYLVLSVLLFIACEEIPSKESQEQYDVSKGIGKFNEQNVDISTFDLKRAENGKLISETKCASCHKFSNERLVGPGWKGVTKRRKHYWLMNFITNPDAMIDNDPILAQELEICLTRMPNQNLSDDEARDILEFMRQIDGAH